jgi:uncharacterized protein
MSPSKKATVAQPEPQAATPIGMVTAVKSQQVKFNLFEESATGLGTIKRFKSCSAGDYVLVGDNQRSYFARVEEVRLNQETPERITATASSQILAEINVETGEIIFGTQHGPQVGDAAHSAPTQMVQLVIDSQEKDDNRHARIHLGEFMNGSHSAFQVSPESLFGRHAAILGATGGGKSWTVARLIEECARFDSKVILFDATGEYYRLNNGVCHVQLGKGPDDPGNALEVSLPYYCLTEGDLFAIFKPSGDSQSPKLRAAMKSLKLARLVPNLAPGGVIPKAYRSKVDFEEEYQNWLDQIENPFAEFDIRHLTKQIDLECVVPQMSPTEPRVWGGPDGIDQGNCVALITRINDIIHSPSLAPIFDSFDTPVLLDELDTFLKDDSTKIFRISLKNLSFAFHAREIVANAIARRVLEWARQGRFISSPVIMILDEAHQFLNDSISDDDSPYPLNSFALISKEGRKYAVNLCIATQRPRDIPEGVLSQIGTMLVHRLVNDLDRKVIERAASDADVSTLAILPSLSPGEALFLGVDFHLPLMIRIGTPRQKPDSRGPDYQKFWGRKGK